MSPSSSLGRRLGRQWCPAPPLPKSEAEDDNEGIETGDDDEEGMGEQPLMLRLAWRT